MGNGSYPAVVALFQAFFHRLQAFSGCLMEYTQHLGYGLKITFNHMSHFGKGEIFIGHCRDNRCQYPLELRFYKRFCQMCRKAFLQEMV